MRASAGYGQHLDSRTATGASGTELTEEATTVSRGSQERTAGSTRVFMETWERWKCVTPAMNLPASIPSISTRAPIPTTCRMLLEGVDSTLLENETGGRNSLLTRSQKCARAPLAVTEKSRSLLVNTGLAAAPCPRSSSIRRGGSAPSYLRSESVAHLPSVALLLSALAGRNSELSAELVQWEACALGFLPLELL